MAKKAQAEVICSHTPCKGKTWLILAVGILFLLVDLGYWKFWNIQWWTAVFLIWGLHGLFCNCHR